MAAKQQRKETDSDKINLIPELMTQMSKLTKTVFGNGVPGLDETVRNIMAWIDSERGRQKEEKDERRYYWRLTVGTAIVTLVTLLINAILYFTRIEPFIESLK